jgi:uncharacterized protein (TIGR00730 family)
MADKRNNQSEKQFLSGPRSRWSELVFVVKVAGELVRAFRKFHFLGPCITFFGSARFDENHPYYEKTVSLADAISKMGFTILTGGGPGIMEAANRGAFEQGRESIGCNIILPHEQKENPYLHQWVKMNYFFTRKVILIKYSYGFIVMPGGMGTVDELFEALTLIQTGKISSFPIVLFGKEYWKPLNAQLELMAEAGTINKEDLKLLLYTDSEEEVIEHLQKHAVKEFGLRKKRIHFSPRKIFGEN